MSKTRRVRTIRTQTTGRILRIEDPDPPELLQRPVDRTMQRTVGIALLCGAGMALVVGGTLSLVTQNWVPTAAVWAVVGPIVGRLSVHYFPNTG